MPRFKLTLEYDGGPFVGWQHQANGLSVQEVLETAIFRFCGEQVRVQAAGRTDSGVHALGQVAHADLEKEADTDTVRDALNHHMKPHPVAVIAASGAGNDSERRFLRARMPIASIAHPRPARRRGARIAAGSGTFAAAPDAESIAGGRRGALGCGRHDLHRLQRQGVPGAAARSRPLDRLVVKPHRRRDPLDRRGRFLPAPPRCATWGNGTLAPCSAQGKIGPRDRRGGARWPFPRTGPPPAPPPRPRGLLPDRRAGNDPRRPRGPAAGVRRARVVVRRTRRRPGVRPRGVGRSRL